MQIGDLTVNIGADISDLSAKIESASSEAGPEAVIPLDRLGAQGDQSHTIIIELDGKTIAKNTMQNMPRMVRLRGMTR